MPNTVPPIIDIESAQKYLEFINFALPAGSSFQPLLVAYLTDETKASELVNGFKEGIFYGAKL